jgi:hypothetical protein
MQPNTEALDPGLIDLGAVSVETQGVIPGPGEPEGRLGVAGICDD